MVSGEILLKREAKAHHTSATFVQPVFQCLQLLYIKIQFIIPIVSEFISMTNFYSPRPPVFLAHSLEVLSPSNQHPST